MKTILEITDYIEKDESNELAIGKDGKIEDSHFRINSYRPEENIEIITNRSENIYIYDMKEIKPTEFHYNIVDKIKEENYTSEVDTEITKVIETDFDKDGNNEEILVVNPVRDETQYVVDEDGACCYIIMIKDKKYKLIYKKERLHYAEEGISYFQIIVKDITLCDINYDNIPELCIEAMSWDIPEYSIYEYDDETKNFEMELYGTFGW